ncbi:MAG: UDP-N-acetylmuramate dehydrogenase [Ruminococcaceae bacterium]|nr:UDP-N-acetylmuramate dehydrogenase [Oscillospiraceae bacterium]
MSTLTHYAKGLSVTAYEHTPMKEHTTFRIGGNADVLFDVHDAASLAELVHRLREDDVPCQLIGAGSNLLIADEGLRGAVIRLDTHKAAIEQLDDTTLRCEAGVMLAKLSRTAQQLGLTGLEFACGIPGSVGGAVYMNAGAYGGEMVQIVKNAEVLLPDGQQVTMSAADLALSYRQSVLMESGGIVLSATVTLQTGNQEQIHDKMAELLTARREKQPLEYPSAGSFFKRPIGCFAGKLIDDCGLRGYRVGDAQVSEKHAGFVVNRGEATCEQVKQLEQDVRTRVYETFGVMMAPEVRLLGTDWL